VPPTFHFMPSAVVSICAACLLPSILCLVQLSAFVQRASYRPFYAYCSCQRLCSVPPTVHFMSIAVVSGCAACLLPSILCLLQLSGFVQRASYLPFYGHCSCQHLCRRPPTVYFMLIAVISVCAVGLLLFILCLLQLSAVVQRASYHPFYAYCSCQHLCSVPPTVHFMPIAVVSVDQRASYCSFFMPIAVVSGCAALISVPPTVHFMPIAVVSVCAACLVPSILCLLQLSAVVQR